jgi:hypothetical protein
MSEAEPPLTDSEKMVGRWIVWILASTLLPLIPILSKDDQNLPIGLISIALTGQLLASVFLAVGISGKRQKGIGGIISVSVLLILASLSMDVAVFFISCVKAVGEAFKH